MRVVLYLRRSTVDLQPESLEAQEEILRAFALRNAHEVVRTYRDSASGRTVQRRHQFADLIERVKSGADFEGILVRDVSRWSRAENTDEAGYYEFLCRSHAVQVIYAEENFGEEGSPYALLMKSMKRAMAAEFSRERSRMVIASHTRLVREGFWPTGSAPYGLQHVLVDGAGRTVGVLQPGERKALASQRVRMAPGDAERVAIVRRIFQAYADGTPMSKISDDLNAAMIPSPRRGRWTTAGVGHVLHTEAYAGALVYRVQRGERRSRLKSLEGSGSERIVRCEKAHESIVSPELWAATRDRLRLTSARKTDCELVADLRDARARWNQTDVVERVAGNEFRDGYEKPDEEVIGKALRLVMGRLRAVLEQRFLVTDFDDGWLLDHLLHIQVRISLPHARFGALKWQFTFTGQESSDVVLGLGFSPPPRVDHVETFFFRSNHWRPRLARPFIVKGNPGTTYHRIENAEELYSALRHAFVIRGKRAEEAFLAKIRNEKTISLLNLARKLDWPAEATRRLYRKLEIRGVPLPPLRNGSTAIRIQVSCPHCLRVRHLSPKVASRLETDVCFDCLHRQPLQTARVLVTCPECLQTRYVWPSKFVKLSAGENTRCRACSWKSGHVGAALLGSRGGA